MSYVRSRTVLLADAWSPFRRRPLLATIRLATLALGLSAVVSTMTLSATSAEVVRAHVAGTAGSIVSVSARPDEAQILLNEASALSLEKATAVGRIDEYEVKVGLSRGAGLGAESRIWGVSESFLRAAEITVDSWPVDHSWEGRKLLVGAGTAKQLDLNMSLPAQFVVVDGLPYQVVGILTDVNIRSETLLGVVAPLDTSRQLFGQPSSSTLIVRSVPGTASVLAAELPYVLSPADPARIEASVPPADPDLAMAISDSVRRGSLATGIVVVVLGLVAIASSTSAEVVRRIPEIGLRRAVGATRLQVVLMILFESGLSGLIAGLLAVCAATLTTSLVAYWYAWTPVVSWTMWLASPVGGALAAALAGLVPAIHASRISPRQALIT